MEAIQIKLLSNKGKVPFDNNDNDNAGYDLFSAEEMEIPPKERRLIKTDIAIRLPVGTYGRIAPRSGLAYKHGLDVLAGVIDRGYSNNVGVILLNTGNESVQVNAGDKIAQIIIEFYNKPGFEQVEELADSKRGMGGFGSTGK
jgi:dUTP pyrophosphatase